MTENFDPTQDADRPEPRRRSIRQIPIPENRRVRRTPISPQPHVESHADDVVDDVMEAEEPVVRPTRSDSFDVPERRERPQKIRDGHFSKIGRRRSPLKIGAIIVLVLALAGFGSTYFASAELTITAKNVSFASPVELTLESPSDYTVVSTSIVERETLPATAERSVERKAAGTIVVYNDFSSDPQELIATTRFQTESGLVYRIPEGIVVPGNTVAGDKTIPGSIETQVVADKAGSEYNIQASTFTIPGFQGTPRFTAFKGQSSAAMSGGFVGTVKTITDEERDQAVARLRSKIEARIHNEIRAKAGEGSIVFSIPPKVSFSDAKILEDGNNVTVEVTATVTGYAVSESALASRIAQTQGAVVPEGTQLRLSNTDTINATLDEQAIAVTVQPSEIRWVVDETAIKNAVAGKKADDVATIISGFSAIETIRADFKPSWASTFPTNSEKITVSVE